MCELSAVQGRYGGVEGKTERVQNQREGNKEEDGSDPKKGIWTR